VSLNCGHQRAYCSSPSAYEHGEPLWNDVDRLKLAIRPPQHSLAILPTESSSSKSGWFRRRKLILSTKYLFHTLWISLHCRKITTWGRRLCVSSELRRSAHYIALNNSSRRQGSNPRTLGPVASTHYTAEVTSSERCRCSNVLGVSERIWQTVFHTERYKNVSIRVCHLNH
jgi:hypothetical protein